MLSLLLSLLLFQAIPTAPVAPEFFAYRVGVVGDNQDGPSVFSTICLAMRDEGIDLLHGNGDHIQHGGQVQGEWLTQWMLPRAPIFDRPVIACRGNHDDVLGFQTFVYPLQLQQGIGLWGAVRIGNVLWVDLDSGDETLALATSMDPGRPQRLWIEALMASPVWTTAQFRIVGHHHPAVTNVWWSSCYYSFYAQQQWIRLWDQLAAAGCTLILNGHAHGYERSHWRGTPMMRVTSGGGGGALDVVCRQGAEVAFAAHHFLTIDVGPTRLRIRALSPGRSVLDEFTVP